MKCARRIPSPLNNPAASLQLRKNVHAACRIKGIKCRRRNAVAVILVLGVLTLTLAIGFAMVRTAGLSSSMQGNYSRACDARLAALTGVSLGLRMMHTGDWDGVDSSFRRDLGEGQSCEVRFDVGDDELSSASEDYWQYPYRVTVTSTGSVQHPLSGQASSTHTIKVVAQLVPRATATAPTYWNEAHAFRVAQWGDQPLELDLPSRIVGDVWAPGGLELMPSYPADSLNCFQGHVDEATLFAKTLSTSQIQAIYNADRGASGDPATARQGQQMYAWWRFNENQNATVAADACGSYPADYEGCQPGAAVVPAAGAGTSAYLNGYGDHIRCGIVPAPDRFTLLVWLRPESLTRLPARVMARSIDTGDWYHDWSLNIERIDGRNRLTFSWRTLLGVMTVRSTSTEVVAGQWTMAAVTFDLLSARLYQDGVLVGERLSLLGPLFTGSSYVTIGDSFPGSSRSRYLRDQERAYRAGLTDQRLLTGRVYVPSSFPDASRALLSSSLKLEVLTAPNLYVTPATLPQEIATYQLYPGGPVYQAANLPNSLSNTRLTADPETNPLGIYRRAGDLTLQSNIRIEGTLLLEGNSDDLTISGGNIDIVPLALPTLQGQSQAPQLPTLVIPGNVEIESTATDVSLSGTVVVGDTFDFETGQDPMSCELRGNLLAERLRVRRRSNWSTSDSTWRGLLRSFLAQLNGGTTYYPIWLRESGLNTDPVFVVQPPSETGVPVWHDWSGPLFVPAEGDEGLTWSVIAWREGE